jgi:Ser/Thr protein kinase RdoA (MazF antagonist)
MSRPLAYSCKACEGRFASASRALIAPRDTDTVSLGPDTAGPAADLLQTVAQAYGLRTPILAERLTGGYANDVFLLKGDPSVVLHVKHPPLDLQSLSWEHRLLEQLQSHLPEIPAPMPSRDGRTFLIHKNRPVWLTPYVQGQRAGSADRRAVAAALGRLHAVQLDLEPRPGHARLSDLPFPPLREMPPAFDSWLPLIAHARTESIELISRLANAGGITVGVTHNDIFPGNVLIHDGKVSALLDWEEADRDWLVWDLASSLSWFCTTGDGAFSTIALRDFVDAYRAASGRVSPEEDHLIVPLLRVKRILEVLRAPTDRHPQWHYQLGNLHAYQALS